MKKVRSFVLEYRPKFGVGTSMDNNCHCTNTYLHIMTPQASYIDSTIKNKKNILDHFKRSLYLQVNHDVHLWNANGINYMAVSHLQKVHIYPVLVVPKKRKTGNGQMMAVSPLSCEGQLKPWMCSWNLDKGCRLHFTCPYGCFE